MPGNVTKAQSRALDWLTGKWQIHPGRLATAIKSLSLYHPATVEIEFGDHGPRGGRCWRYRLTEAGLSLKALLPTK